MDYKIVYTKTAQQDLAKLQHALAVRILQKVRYFTGSADPFAHAKKLKNFTPETYRFRVGDYRILFRPDEQKKTLVILVVLTIAHRKEAYRKQ